MNVERFINNFKDHMLGAGLQAYKVERCLQRGTDCQSIVVQEIHQRCSKILETASNIVLKPDVNRQDGTHLARRLVNPTKSL